MAQGCGGSKSDIPDRKLLMPPMVRQSDYKTSKAAAAKLRPHLNQLHEKVLALIKERGPINDWDLENSRCFAEYAPSTIRKRRSELFYLGRIKVAGVNKNVRGSKMTLWVVA